MIQSPRHLILYDRSCGLCDQTVKTLLKIDKNQILAFAPLLGPTSTKIIEEFPQLKAIDSAVLVEDFQTSNKKIYTESTTVFRVFWLMGGACKIPGSLFFLPSFLFNWFYHFISRNRYKLIAQSCLVPPKNQKHRFLP